MKAVVVTPETKQGVQLREVKVPVAAPTVIVYQ
jgi:hypothetical protein